MPEASPPRLARRATRSRASPRTCSARSAATARRSRAPSASRSDAGPLRARSTSPSRRCLPWSRACAASRRADVRLFLFDIDGTLLVARGAGRAAFRQALERTYGTAGALDVYDLRGKTDPRIVWDVLTAAGVPGEAIEARLGDCFEAYVRELETILGDGHAVELMPGIRELVGALSARPDAVVGLLTGNIEAGARLKLHPTGLLPHFRVGAYGSGPRHPPRPPPHPPRPAPPPGGRGTARAPGADIREH